MGSDTQFHALRCLIAVLTLLNITAGVLSDEVPLPTQGILTTLTTTITSLSKITVYTTSTSIDPNCNNSQPENCAKTVFTLPVVSTVTDYVATTVISTIGATTLQSSVPAPATGSSASPAPTVIAGTTTAQTPNSPIPTTSVLSSSAIPVYTGVPVAIPSPAPTTTSLASPSTSLDTAVPRTSTSTSALQVTSAPAPNTAEQQGSGHVLSSGAIAGIAIGVVLGTLTAAGVVYISRRSRKPTTAAFDHTSADHSARTRFVAGLAALCAPFAAWFAALRGRDKHRDDDSQTMVDNNSFIDMVKTPTSTSRTMDSPTSENPPHRHNMEDPDFARAFFQRGRNG